jgi:hypothetical protein
MRLFLGLMSWQRALVSLFLLSALVSCQSAPQRPSSGNSPATVKDKTTQNPVTKDDAKSQNPSKVDNRSTKDRPKPVEAALKPGRYCYKSSDAIQDIQTRLTVDAASQVTGNVQGTVHDKSEGYYTGYRSTLNGTIDGSNLNLDVATWIEYDQQNEQETWRVSPDELRTERDKLTNASCDIVNKAFQDENGLEAKDLTESANRVETKPVYFEAGQNSTTLSNSVVRGDVDLYTLTAQGGQAMTLSLASTENNAVFSVVDPSGLILGTELTDQSVSLPYSGEYQIIVGGTRGNATYDLAIAIK